LLLFFFLTLNRICNRLFKSPRLSQQELKDNYSNWEKVHCQPCFRLAITLPARHAKSNTVEALSMTTSGI